MVNEPYIFPGSKRLLHDRVTENLLVTDEQGAKKTLAAMKEGKVLIVGDVMLDMYVSGDADRVSPEAPVPVVLVEEETALLGGAGNVARNVTALGGRSVLVGVTGEDPLSAQVEELLIQEGVTPKIISSPDRPTTVKLRIIARRQQMLRVDKEKTTVLPEAIVDRVMEQVEPELADSGTVILSDYGKGLISPYFMQCLAACMQKNNAEIPVFVDPKPQNKNIYKGATMLTPNAKETMELTNLAMGTFEEILAAGKKLMDETHVPYLLTTLGARGMVLFSGVEEVWHIPTSARRVFDVTGAGDTVIATCGLAVAGGIPLLKACQIANAAAGQVVAEVGAAVPKPSELINAVLEVSPERITRLA